MQIKQEAVNELPKGLLSADKWNQMQVFSAIHELQVNDTDQIRQMSNTF